MTVRLEAVAKLAERDDPDQVELAEVGGDVVGLLVAEMREPVPDSVTTTSSDEVVEPLELPRTRELVDDLRDGPGLSRGDDPITDELPELGGTLRGVGVIAVPQEPTNVVPNHLTVANTEHR